MSLSIANCTFNVRYHEENILKHCLPLASQRLFADVLVPFAWLSCFLSRIGDLRPRPLQLPGLLRLCTQALALWRRTRLSWWQRRAGGSWLWWEKHKYSFLSDGCFAVCVVCVEHHTLYFSLGKRCLFWSPEELLVPNENVLNSYSNT